MRTEAKKAWLTRITSLSSHDGPGVRTTLFFKGCSLQCSWCHNPETIHSFPELEWQSLECIGCRKCEAACQSGAIDILSGNGYPVDKKKCIRCFRCVEDCPAGALKVNGKSYSVEEVVHRIRKDEDLIKKMQGGITFSGGEPALQADFIQEVAQIVKKQGIHIALDTCGQVDVSAYEKLLPLIDLLLFDIKESDPVKHKQFTQAGNEKILSNLFYVATRIREQNLPVRIWIRTPLVPGMTATEENIMAIGCLLSENLDDLVERWELCAFNNMCTFKYKQLGQNWKLAHIPLLGETDMSRFLSVARKAAPRIQHVTATGLTKK